MYLADTRVSCSLDLFKRMVSSLLGGLLDLCAVFLIVVFTTFCVATHLRFLVLANLLTQAELVILGVDLPSKIFDTVRLYADIAAVEEVSLELPAQSKTPEVAENKTTDAPES